MIHVFERCAFWVSDLLRHRLWRRLSTRKVSIWVGGLLRSDYIGDVYDMKSNLGYVFMLRSSEIS